MSIPTSIPTVQPFNSQPLHFAGKADVKRNLVLAARAGAAYANDGDRFNLGQLHTYAAQAISDPEFADVVKDVADGENIVDETVQVAGNEQETLAESLKSRGALQSVFEALREQIVFAEPGSVDKLDVSVPVKNEESLRRSFGMNPDVVVKRVFEALVANAFRLDGPYADALKLLERFQTAIERQLEDSGVRDLPIFKQDPDAQRAALDAEWG